VARDDADTGSMKEDAERALNRYLHPLTGGEGRDGWPFGAALRYSKLMQQLFADPRVDSVAELQILVDGEAAPVCTDVPIDVNALVYSGAHSVDVVTAREVEQV
jgi:hypothetical protein